jgi:hypothetical protein
MSWSVDAVGTPEAVRAKLVEKFTQAKRNVHSNVHEAKTVELAEQLVNAELDYCHEQGCAAVTVSAGGSCSAKSGTWAGQSQLSIKVSPIFEFLK